MAVGGEGPGRLKALSRPGTAFSGGVIGTRPSKLQSGRSQAWSERPAGRKKPRTRYDPGRGRPGASGVSSGAGRINSSRRGGPGGHPGLNSPVGAGLGGSGRSSPALRACLRPRGRGPGLRSAFVRPGGKLSRERFSLRQMATRGEKQAERKKFLESKQIYKLLGQKIHCYYLIRYFFSFYYTNLM